MPAGAAFIKHEYDEGIAIQQIIVAAAEKLSTQHPVPDAKQAITAQLEVDRRQLKELQELGAAHGAKGKTEDVVEGMGDLMTKTLEKATEKGREESDVYEAHAVLLSLKRKQLDSAGGMIKTATDRGDKEAVTAHRTHERELKAATQELADSLASFAVRIQNLPTEK